MLLFSQLETYIGRKCTGVLSVLLFDIFPRASAFSFFTPVPASFTQPPSESQTPCRLLLCQYKHDGPVCLSGDQMFICKEAAKTDNICVQWLQ